MSTNISRAYADSATAQSVVEALGAAGFPPDLIDTITGGPGEDTAALAARIEAAGVGSANAATYAAELAGRPLVVVRAPFTPFGAALRAMQIADAHGPVDLGIETANEYVPEAPMPLRDNKVLRNRRFLTGTPEFERLRERGPVTAKFLKLLLRHRTGRSAMSGRRHMMPFQPLTKHREGRSAIAGGGTVFSNAIGLPLLTGKR